MTGYKKFKNSFHYALTGLANCYRQPNLRIQTLILFCTCVAAAILECSRVEWMFILLCGGLVLGLEILNTAIEATCDLVTKNNHPLIKQAKDAAAGSVLLASLFSILIGSIIFFPKLKLIFHSYFF